MSRDLLPHLPVVVAVAREGGFAAAAAVLGLSPATVSHSVKYVETRLGTPLFVRTTRSSALTEAGRRLVEASAKAFQEIEDSIDQVRASGGRPSGLLRINLSSIALPMVVERILAKMASDYPDVRVESFVDNALRDIVAEGFDAGIRLGEMIAQDMTAVRLTPPFRVLVVGTPAYLDRVGRPKTIAQLSSMNCITYRQITGKGLYRWELRENGSDVSIETQGTIIVNDVLAARDLALAGVGLAYLFEPLVDAQIADGRLEVVLERCAITEPGLFLYYPRRSADQPKLRAFIDTAVKVARG